MDRAKVNDPKIPIRFLILGLFFVLLTSAMCEPQKGLDYWQNVEDEPQHTDEDNHEIDGGIDGGDLDGGIDGGDSDRE